MSNFRISVDLHKGEALITFDQPYSWVSLSPENARKIGKALLEVADQAEKERASVGAIKQDLQS